MRHIQKSTDEPESLLMYRKTAGDAAYWDGFENKASLRPILLKDQGHLCCYCMCRIDLRNMKIEHYQSQKIKSECLSWNNLFAACRGGEGQPLPQQTCDTQKGDAQLTIDPRNERHIDKLRYLANGEIGIADNNELFKRDINNTLNLNAPILIQQRAQALDGFLLGLKKRLGIKGGWTRSKLQKELDRLASKSKLPSFCGVFEWWLKKRLARF